VLGEVIGGGGTVARGAGEDAAGGGGGTGTAATWADGARLTGAGDGACIEDGWGRAAVESDCR
jgi:hypothetical protein